jgi:hypothetical protein
VLPDDGEVRSPGRQRWRAGLKPEVPIAPDDPYALEMAGESARAAELWAQTGCPYESALALASSDDEHALRQPLTELQRLGARPAADFVARRLHQLDVRGLPRGPKRQTKNNPASLTTREVEVLALIAQGLRSADSPSGSLCLARRSIIMSRRSFGSSACALVARRAPRLRGWGSRTQDR